MTLECLINRACERLDPRARFGLSWVELDKSQQAGLLAYDQIRSAEEARFNSGGQDK